MMKKGLTIFLSLVFAVSLAGCGSKGPQGTLSAVAGEASANSDVSAVFSAEGVTVVLPEGASPEGWQDAEGDVYVLPFSLEGDACALYLRRSDGVDLSMAGARYVPELPVDIKIDPYEPYYSFYESQMERTGAVFWTRDGFAFALTVSDCSDEAPLKARKAAVDAGITVETG